MFLVILKGHALIDHHKVVIALICTRNHVVCLLICVLGPISKYSQLGLELGFEMCILIIPTYFDQTIQVCTSWHQYFKQKTQLENSLFSSEPSTILITEAGKRALFFFLLTLWLFGCYKIAQISVFKTLFKNYFEIFQIWK